MGGKEQSVAVVASFMLRMMYVGGLGSGLDLGFAFGNCQLSTANRQPLYLIPNP
jgi:hypothetical protein